MKRTQEDNINFFMQKEGAQKIIEGKQTFIIYQPLCIAMFEGRKAKPIKHYKFKDADSLYKFMMDEIKYAEKLEKEHAERLKKYEGEKAKFQVGAILYSSWGYEQTNIDFYQIIERKNDFVILQEIGQDKTYDANFNDRGSCTPDPAVKVGEPFRKKISKYASISLTTYSSASLWDGHSLSWSSYA